MSSAVDTLNELGEDSGVNPARITLLRNLMAGLKDPFLFVVVGEVNAGKSTLLNALFGADFCSTDVLPTTDKIGFFKHGNESHEFEVSEDVLEIYRPNEFLKDFNIVDTPGTNSIELHHQQITEHFLPMADLVLFVFSVTNPWGATTWDLLDRIHHQWKKKVVFVLQQCDLRTEEEVNAILEHLQRTAHHRFGQHFPTFSVSAKQAFLAKTSGHDKEALWGASHVEALEQYISSVVESSETRLTKLISTWRAACYVLGEVKEKLGAAAEIIRADTELLSGLEAASKIQLGRTLTICEPLFEAFDQSFMAAGLQAEPFLESEFKILATLTPGAKTSEQIEDLVFATTMKAVRRSVGVGANAVQEDVQQLWERVSDEMAEAFNLQLSVGEDGEPDWSESRKRIEIEVEAITAETLKKLKLKQELKKRFRARSRGMWTFVLLSGASVAAGIILGMQKIEPWNVVCYGLAALFLLLGAVLGSRSVTRIRRYYSENLEEQRKALAHFQRKAFESAAGSFFNDFVQLFEPLRKVCRDHRKRYDPQLKAIDQVELNLTELERILTPVEKALQAQASKHDPVAAETVEV
ncbi:MAG: GTP-binding protein [Verrucomicrobiales bacterium]|nr:GTP-binding protein [Verrucomicrobiales bacterium]